MFSNGDLVTISRSGEEGLVIGIATYLRDSDSFYVEYKAADGRASKGWFAAEELIDTAEDK